MVHIKPKHIRIALIIIGMGSLMFWCFFAFIAHAWVQAPKDRVLIDIIIFIAAPFFSWFAWQGSNVASRALYGANVFILWLPPWAIMPFSYMAIATVTVLVFGYVLWYTESRIQQDTPGDAKTARLS